MSLTVVLCFFNFFMSYRWPRSSIQHYQPIEWVKCRSPFENKDTILTLILGRNESVRSYHIQKANISSFIRTQQSIKYWLKVSTKPSSCHFSGWRANLGCGCLQHWELDLDCSSFTSDIFHARSQLYNTVIEASHYLRPMLSFKYSWKTHQS